MRKPWVFLLFLLLCGSCQPNSDTSQLSPEAQIQQKRFGDHLPVTTRHTVQQDRDTILTGPAGTLVYLPADIFISSSGEPIQEKVNIQLTEVYEMATILSQNISMRAGDRLLETGGMINITATADNQELRLKEDQGLIIHFPKKVVKEGMQLFYGQTNQDSDSTALEWEQEPTSGYRLKNNIVPWYTKYDDLDGALIYLPDGRHIYDTLSQHFNFSETEIAYFLNKTVDAHYILFGDGDMHFMRLEGSTIHRQLKNKIIDKVKNFPVCRPYYRDGFPIDMPGHFKIWTEVIPPAYQSNEAYLDQLSQQLAEGNTQTSLDLAEVQYYIFDARRLGWMNCDRFINSTAKRTNFVVRPPRMNQLFTKIIFTNYKTVMTGDQIGQQFVFRNLPIGEPVKVVVMAERDQQPLLKIINTTVSETELVLSELSSYTYETLAEELKKL